MPALDRARTRTPMLPDAVTRMVAIRSMQASAPHRSVLGTHGRFRVRNQQRRAGACLARLSCCLLHRR